MFTATCGVATTDGKPHACPTGKVYNDKMESTSPPNDANCCMDTTCAKVEYHKHGDEYEFESFTCPSGKVPNEDNEESAATEANCCKVFVPMCYMATKYVADYPYDLFPCPAGMTLNTTDGNHKNTVVSQASCCEPFKPTCSFNSGSILRKVEFDCAALDKQMKSNVDDLDASEANCCGDFTATCGQPLVSQKWPFQCPASKPIAQNKQTAPSEATCCKTASCGEGVPETCESWGKRSCSEQGEYTFVKNSVSDKQIDGMRTASKTEMCCTPKSVFSGAPAIGGAVAIALSFATLLLL